MGVGKDLVFVDSLADLIDARTAVEKIVSLTADDRVVSVSARECDGTQGEGRSVQCVVRDSGGQSRSLDTAERDGRCARVSESIGCQCVVEITDCLKLVDAVFAFERDRHGNCAAAVVDHQGIGIFGTDDGDRVDRGGGDTTCLGTVDRDHQVTRRSLKQKRIG